MSKTKIPTRLRYEVLNRDGLKCKWCGRSAADGVKLHIDHVIPESFGGETSYDNLGTLCEKCNLGKSNDFPGNYLLTTLLKVKDLNIYIDHNNMKTSLGPDGGQYDGNFFEYKISFFIDEAGAFRLKTISSPYLKSGPMLRCTTEDCEIKMDIKMKVAREKLMELIKNFLYEKEGYLEEINGRLIFKEVKSNEG